MWLTRKLAAMASLRKRESLNNVQRLKRCTFDPVHKPLPPLTVVAEHATADRAMTLVVCGAGSVGKSTLIRVGVPDTQLGSRDGWPRRRAWLAGRPVDILEVDATMFDPTRDPPEFPKGLATTTTIDGGLICYDTTSRDSLDCLPDLLNVFVAYNIPILLVGLKTDQTVQRQVDPLLVRRLADLFGVESVEVNAYSEMGIQHMKDIYAALIQRCQFASHHTMKTRRHSSYDARRESKRVLRFNSMIDEHPAESGCSFSTTSSDSGSAHDPHRAGTTLTTHHDPLNHPIDFNNHSNKRRSSGHTAAAVHLNRHMAREGEATVKDGSDVESNHSDCDCDSGEHDRFQSQQSLSGFVYAPTMAEHDVRSTITDHAFCATSDTRRGSISLIASRRGSKDSTDSFGNGLTIDDLVDRLLASEVGRGDEYILPVFLTFYRKFMKPSDLVKILIERFEYEELTGPTATFLQKRIESVLTLWLTQHWSDFHGHQTRKMVILFLDRISQYEALRPTCDALAPLAVREPPLRDPDALWGFSNMDEETEMALGKGGVHAASSFTMAHAATDPAPRLKPALSAPSSPRNREPAGSSVLQRTSSTGSIGLLARPRKASITSSFNIFASLRPTIKAHIQPVTSRHALPPNWTEQRNDVLPPSRAEFAGGLINIDAEGVLSNSTSSPSLGAHTISSSATSMRSISGQQGLTRSLSKDQLNHNFTVFMEMADTDIAEQLTWIEAELFTKIKPREFVRNIWASTHGRRPTSVSSEEQIHSKRQMWMEQTATHPQQASALLASISHFNFLSAWVVSVIVTQAKVARRAALLEKFMSIAVLLRNLNNYNTVMALLAGINSAAILRLKHTRQLVTDKKIYKQFQSLERLMSSDRSFTSYRLALKASGAPCIPYLGIHNQDLVSLAEANKDFKADGTIHWEKFRLMGESIMAMTKFQSPSYTLQPDSNILQFIADHELLSEDDQYQRSILVEPRMKSSSTNRLRDLWLRI